jgi:chorismate mutase
MRTQSSSVLTELRHAPAPQRGIEAPARTWFAVRGATTVPRDDREEILSATRALLARILVENELRVEDVVSAFFVVTRDLTAAYPAEAARQIGWTNAALLCAADMEVVGSLKRCVRVLLHVYGEQSLETVRHVYLGDAASLRPDWAKRNEQGPA